MHPPEIIMAAHSANPFCCRAALRLFGAAAQVHVTPLQHPRATRKDRASVEHRVARKKIFFVTQGKTKKIRNDQIKKGNVAVDRARKADPRDLRPHKTLKFLGGAIPRFA
jgi:hypothetical protein